MCRILFPNELVIQACLPVLAVIAYRGVGTQSWLVVLLRDNKPSMRLPVGTIVAWWNAAGGPTARAVVDKKRFRQILGFFVAEINSFECFSASFVSSQIKSPLAVEDSRDFIRRLNF